jgi:leucyl-tRNA synthetase
MQFKAALKVCFFDLQSARDRYVVMCGFMGLPLHRASIARFMEVQALLLSVFCPHTAEQMWSELGHSDSILRARFPQAGAVDAEVLAQDAYVQEVLHLARDKIKHARTAAAKGKAPAVPAKLAVALMYVSKTYPEWQQKAIRILHDVYRASGNTIPEDNLGSHFKAHDDLKPQMKKIMALASDLRDEAKRRGEQAFALTSAFDELALLTSMSAYVKGALELEAVHFYDASNPQAPDPEKRRANAVPGKPAVAIVSTSPA